MPKEEFVMRGQTASTSGLNEVVLNFGSKHGYAFRLIEFELYPSFNIGGGASADYEASASITAGKTSIDPAAPNFNDEGLIATALFLKDSTSAYYQFGTSSVVNDTFLITQDLILRVHEQSGNALPVNWQCRFKPVKMTTGEQANANLRQFHVFDE
jgi:hypothetical protein